MKNVKLSPLSESKFPDIPDLKFYQGEGELFYFDATYLLGKIDPPSGKSIQEFRSKFDYALSMLRERNEVADEDMIVCDDKGNIYLEESAALLFLSYVESWFGPYMIERVEEMLRYGVTLNDNMLRFMNQTRFDNR